MKAANPVTEMSQEEILQQQELLLHDNSYLQDKSVKKVSLATLKRRQNQINTSNLGTSSHEKPSKKEHTSIFATRPNKAFLRDYNEEVDEIQVITSKRPTNLEEL